jgi:hypothetical protein
MSDDDRIEAGMFQVYNARRDGKSVVEQLEIAASYNLTTEEFEEARALAAMPDHRPDDVIELVEKPGQVWRALA